MAEIRIPVALERGGVIEWIIYGREGTLQSLDPALAGEYGEAPWQLQESREYEYLLPEGYQVEGDAALVTRSRIHPSQGKIRTGNYTGTWKVRLSHNGHYCGETEIEIGTAKMDYRTDYRRMLEDITGHCTEILLQRTSPVVQPLVPEGVQDARTLYQRFAFVRSLVDSEDFILAIQRILSAPMTRWAGEQEDREVWRAGRLGRKVLTHIASARERVPLPAQHPLAGKISSLPAQLRISRAGETVDIPENRFVKYVLNRFLSFCVELHLLPEAGGRLRRESRQVILRLEQWLRHGMWQEVDDLQLLPLHSPVLQRREGYREVLRAWLQFDLAATLVWQGGEDVYAGGKRDVAVLYEYWLFFKLATLTAGVFGLELNTKQLIEVTEGGLSVRLRRGQHVAVAGVYDHPVRRLNVELSYNRTFRGERPYPEGGSWTHDMRPDYTLTIWPVGISQQQAEREELIVHLHFDAKYRINRLSELVGEETDERPGETPSRTAPYKRDDMLKMHAYRDSIRRSAGAFVLYPGRDDGHRRYRSFHEILPGIGAFAIHPSAASQGLAELRTFLREMTEHFLNRTSRREKLSYYTYQVNRRENEPPVVQEPLPELYGKNRGLFADETTVLIAWYKDKKHLQWILKEGLYNLRTGSRQGSVRLSKAFMGARYVLLHTSGEHRTPHLLRILPEDPRIFSRTALIKRGYPSGKAKGILPEDTEKGLVADVSLTADRALGVDTALTTDAILAVERSFIPERESVTDGEETFYLVYSVELADEAELKGKSWDIRLLSDYRGGRQAALPFTTTLAQLASVVVRADMENPGK